MIEIRKSDERGHVDHGWLNTKHTFSFAGYFDPKYISFRSLRVINEDIIEAGSGFGAHPHRDMEIITYVIAGCLEHKDSTGTSKKIWPGEVQCMSAGSGVIHSEFNALPDSPTHILQIWLHPKEKGGNPSYDQRSFTEELKTGKLTLVVSEQGRANSLSIRQDADIYIARIKATELLEFNLRKSRGAWVQVIHGEIKVNDKELLPGDGAAFSNEEKIIFNAQENSEFLLFDLV